MNNFKYGPTCPLAAPLPPREVTLGKNLVGGNSLLLLDTITIITVAIIIITIIIIIIITPGSDSGKELRGGTLLRLLLDTRIRLFLLGLHSPHHDRSTV